MSEIVPEQQPPNPSVVPPRRPRGRLASTLAAMPSRDWLVAVFTGVAAYVAAYLVGVIGILLTAAIAAANSGSSGGIGSGSSSGLNGSSASTSVSDVFGAIGNVFAGPAQLVSLADLGRFGGRVAGSGFLTSAGSAQVGVVPVFVAAAQIVALVVITRLAGRRTARFSERLATSVATGLVLLVVTLVAGLVFSFRIPETSGISISALSATTPGSVLVALLVGVGATLLARPLWLSRVHPVVNAGLGILRVAMTHVGALAVLVAIVLVVWSAVADNGSGAVMPLLLGNIAIAVTAVGMFGGVSVSESTSQVLSAFGGSADGASGTLSAFSSPTGWVWAVVVAAVVFAVVAGFAASARRGAPARPNLDWALTGGAYLVVGLLVLVVGTVVFRVSISGIGGSGSAGITPWTPLVFLLWGGAVEAVARWVAPRVLASSPASFRILTRIVGSDASGWAPIGTSTPRPVAPVVHDGPAEASGNTPSAGYGASGYGDAAGQPTPMSPRARKIVLRSVIAGGALVVVVIAASITGSVLRNSVWGPGPVAERFVQAVADGDASGAGDLAEIRGIGSGMLTDRVLHAAAHRISDVSVGTVRKSGDTAVATVTYRQGGDRHSASVTLRRTGTSWLVKDDWRVTSSLVGQVYLSVPDALDGAAVTANGVRVGTAKDGALTLSAFPGDYRLSIGGTKYFAGTTKTVSVVADDVASERLSVRPTKALTADAEKLVTDTITSCAAETTGDLPDACPFYGAYGQTSGVTYAVTKMPELKVDVASDGTVEVSSTASGEVETKYVDTFFGDAYPYDDTDSFRVSEYLIVKDGKLQVDDRY